MPIIFEIVQSGSFMARSLITSPPPCSTKASTMRLASVVIPSWRRATCFGVKAPLTMRRSSVCRGASITRKEAFSSKKSFGTAPIPTPSPEQKTSG